MLAEYPLIPKEAFLFFPKQQEIVQYRNGRNQRIIFQGGVPWTQFQKEKLANLHRSLSKQKKHHHLSFFSQAFLVRFLQATKYDNQDCIKALKEYKKWEDAVLPLTLKPEIEQILKRGMFYMIGRDSSYRPIIVVNVARILDLDLKEKVFFEALGYYFQFVIENCLLEGQVETWITIIDLGKVGMFSLGGALIDTISFLSNHFRCRLHHSYLINCPSSIKFLWGMVKGALNQDQLRKLNILEDQILPQIAYQNINREDVQKKYGGNGKDFEEFWPIRLIHRKPTEAQAYRLISIEQYNQMHGKGLLKKKKICKQLIDQYELVPERIHALPSSSSIVTEDDNKDEMDNGDQIEIPLQDQPFQVELPSTPIDYRTLFQFN